MNNKEKKTHSMKARGMISDVIVHVVLALLAIVWVIPVLWIALLSFSTQKGSYVTSFFPKGYHCGVQLSDFYNICAFGFLLHVENAV